MYKIVRKVELNPSVTQVEIEAPLVAKKAQPGQFIILRVDDEGERIPLTIAGYNREEGTVKIIFQVVGGTAKVCQNGGSEIYVDSVKVRTKTKGDLVIAYLGSESKDQVVFDNTKEWTILKERADEKVQNADLVKMNPVVPAVGTNGKPVPTDLGEALLVAPDVEYDIVVYLHQNVVATTDGKSEMKSYSYSTTLKNFNDEKAGFEHGRSYNVQISLWGLSQITVTTKLDKWNDGGNIDMPIEDLDVPRI
jgi:hypothetical protein